MCVVSEMISMSRKSSINASKGFVTRQERLTGATNNALITFEDTARAEYSDKQFIIILISTENLQSVATELVSL